MIKVLVLALLLSAPFPSSAGANHLYPRFENDSPHTHHSYFRIEPNAPGIACISAAQRQFLQEFNPELMKRIMFKVWRQAKWQNYTLLVAWHVDRSMSRCVSADENRQSKAWLKAKGLSNVRFNPRTGNMNASP